MPFCFQQAQKLDCVPSIRDPDSIVSGFLAIGKKILDRHYPESGAGSNPAVNHSVKGIESPNGVSGLSSLGLNF
jgi:hypothetical protein